MRSYREFISLRVIELIQCMIVSSWTPPPALDQPGTGNDNSGFKKSAEKKKRAGGKDSSQFTVQRTFLRGNMLE
jgi:hypothetical protein